MFIKREDITVFISDFKCSYFVDRPTLNTSLFDAIDLPEGVVINGYIKEPEILYQLLLSNMKLHKFKLRSVNILIHDQNLLIRDMTIAKDELQKKTINQYLHEQTDKKVYFPFEKAAISHHVRDDNEESVTTLALITDENLLHDYYDVFERLGAKEVTFDLPALSLYELYKEQTKTKSNQIMLVTLYNKLLAIQIFANDSPVFQMIEECNGQNEKYQEILENYIERIANYYKYNITKGELEVEDIVIFNLSDTFNDSDISNGLVKKLNDYKTILFDFDRVDKFEKLMPKTCYLPYASIKTKNVEFALNFEFKLERLKRVNLYGNYLMVASFFIFTAILLVYIPFYVFSEDIANQQNINQSLENQLFILKRDQPELTIYSDEQITFNEVYQYLSESEKSYKPYLEDLFGSLNPMVLLNSFEVNESENQIVIIISGDTREDLDEYILAIYESYGQSDQIEDDSRWIISAPTVDVFTDTLLEVTITHE